MALSPSDPNSHSRPDQIITTNLKFDWDVDFEKNIVSGTTEITCKRCDPEARTLLLDVNNLQISCIIYNDTMKLTYDVGPCGPCGSKLEINLPDQLEDEFKVLIHYSTSTGAPSMDWLTKDQTSGKKYPFVFSQGQAILNRSLFPCQDTPAVKTPYQATVRAPSHLLVLMSALVSGEPTDVSDGIKEHKFQQPIPIPSYLVAFAVGDLEAKDIGPRSRVYAEKEHIEKAAFDFSETEDKLKIAEKLCGPYLWSRYDILVLPSSFAFGGMENPCLTFVTPTLLTGDKSNSDVIAHEISHSWTGNLITNTNFEHFWLNEGFTVFIERKIKGRLKGEKERHFTTLLRWQELEECVFEEFNPEHEYTKLIPNLVGVDPDDAFCRIPYEKGSTFLWYLEELVGGETIFEPFLKSYFEEFANKSLDSEKFKEYFCSHFKETKAISDIDWETWFFKPGMPPYKPNCDTSLAEECWNLAEKWIAWDKNDVLDCNSMELDSLSPTQIQEFLSHLLQKAKLKAETIAKMDEMYNLSTSSNCEILYLFLRLGLKSEWEESFSLTMNFLKSMGRLKYTRPLYRDLIKWPNRKNAVVDFFNENKHLLMASVVDGVKKDLNIS